MKRIQLKVNGMHCKSCVVLIKDILEDEEGINNAQASLEDSSVEIEMEDAVTKDRISKILMDEGYIVK